MYTAAPPAVRHSKAARTAEDLHRHPHCREITVEGEQILTVVQLEECIGGWNFAGTMDSCIESESKHDRTAHREHPILIILGSFIYELSP